MTEKENNLAENIGQWALWIVSGLVWILEGSVAIMLLPIIYATRRNNKDED